jgi:hypothetical protein
MGMKAKQEYREVDKLIQDLSKQSLSTSTLTTSKQTSPPLSSHHVANFRYVATISSRCLSYQNLQILVYKYL